MNMEIIQALQRAYYDTFDPPAVFDGRKNMFSTRELPLGGTSKEARTPECNRILLSSSIF
jgi:hypothetical protein